MASDIEGYVLTEELLKDFEGFDCGSDGEWSDELNSFLRENAIPEGAGRFNTTYAFYDDQRHPIAYVTLSADAIERKKARKLLGGSSPHPTIPAVHIGRIAVDTRYQNKHHGTAILGWIEKTATNLPVGCRLLVLYVDATNEPAQRMYERYGFEAPPDINVGRRELIMVYDLLDTHAAAGGMNGKPAGSGGLSYKSE